MKNRVSIKILLTIVLVFMVTANILAAEAVTLEEILRLGIKNNTGVKELEMDRRKAEIDLDSAGRAFYPEISISSSYTRMFFDDNGDADFGGGDFNGMMSTASQVSMEVQQLSLDPELLEELNNNLEEFNKNSLIINEKMNFIIDSMSAMQPSEDNYQTAISIQQPIYLGGRLRIGKEQAEKGV